jgi:hypothetical protein
MVIVAAAVTVTLHHTVVWALWPASVFNYEASIGVVAVHASFVVVESLAAIYLARSFFDSVIGMEKIVEQRTDDLRLANRSMRLVLQHVNQGLLTVDRAGTLAHERSAMVDQLLGPAPATMRIEDYLRNVDPAVAEWFSLGWEDLISGIMPVEVTLDQLPRQLSNGERHLSVSYIPISDEGAPSDGSGGNFSRVLMVLSDDTAEIRTREVEAQRLRWEILEAFREAAAEQGIPPSDDFNRGDNFGCGYFEVNQRRGVRWNASKAFLRTAITRRNLTVISGAHVERLRLSEDGMRVLGVEVRDAGGGEARFVAANREVVLAAGAVGSPQILELSGIGRADTLGRAGIALKRELPGVGENLQDHLQLRMAFKVNGVPTLNVQANSWLGKARMGLEYLFFRSGPMSMAPSQDCTCSFGTASRKFALGSASRLPAVAVFMRVLIFTKPVVTFPALFTCWLATLAKMPGTFPPW